MTRRIRGITKRLAHDLCKELPRLGIIEYVIGEGDLADLVLDDPVILKSYDDHVTLDLGGKLMCLSKDQFVSIEIG